MEYTAFAFSLLALVTLVALFLGSRAIGTVNSQINETHEKLDILIKELDVNRRQLSKLQAENAQLLKKMLGYDFDLLEMITGGNSFCYVECNPHTDNSGTWFPVVIHHGDIPLYDVDIRIINLRRVNQVDRTLPVYERQQFTDILLNVGNLPVDRSFASTELRIPLDEEFGYNIYITARNGYFMQKLRFCHQNGQWLTGTEMKKYRNASFEDSVYTQFDDGFPEKQFRQQNRQTMLKPA